MLAREELTEEQLNLCRDIRYVILKGEFHENSCSTTCWPGAAQPLQGHQVGHIQGSVPRELLFNDMLTREELTEEQLNLCRDIRYVIVKGEFHENSCSTTCWPGRS